MPSVGNILRASVQADIVVETGLLYAATLALRRTNIQGQAKAERQREKKRKCGERGEEVQIERRKGKLLLGGGCLLRCRCRSRWWRSSTLASIPRGK